MKNKKNIVAILLIVFAIVIVYTFVSFKINKTEIQFLTKWTIPLNEIPLADSNSTSDLIGFCLGDTLGYFSLSGNLAYKYQIPTLENGTLSNISMSSRYWTVFNQNSSDVSVFNPDGSVLFKTSHQGNPFIYEDRFYLFAPSGSSFLRYDLEGNALWSSEGYVPIISFSSSLAGTVVGYADGEVRCLSDSGEQIFSMYPGGSTYPIVLGVDISDSGEFVSCVSGIDSQRFVLIRRTSNQQKIVFHEYLEGSVKENVNVFFTKDSNFVYYNFENNLGIVDCNKLVSKHLPVKGKILKISEIPDVNVVFVLSKQGSDCTITIIEGMSNILGVYEYQAENTFISCKDDKLFLGADDKISCIQILKK